MLARVARVVVAAALLAGWQAALLHPLEHYDDDGLVHLGHQSSENSELCDALAALAACAPTAAFSFGSAPASDARVSTQQPAPRAAEAPPFLAQAPPDSL